MLKGQLVHPEILSALGAAGHGSKILISDGNYPASTTLGPNASLVHLNLSPGRLDVTEVLEALLAAVPVESAAVMDTLKSGPYALEEDPPIWNGFRELLRGASSPAELDKLERLDFYRAASKPDVALVVQTGDQRIYANILLTIGVVFPAET